MFREPKTDILVVGDVHGSWSQIEKAIRHAKELGLDTIFQVGDYGIWSNDKPFLNKQQALLEEWDMQLLFIDGNHECVSEDTKAVTPEGFKHYSELSVGDLVLSCDDDGNEQWQPVQDIITKPFSGEMMSVQSRGLDMLMTPGHRVVFKTGSDAWREVLAGNLNKSTKKIVRSVSNTKTDSGVSDDMLKLYAWCVTDGSHRKDGGWHIYQRQSAAHRITEILDNLEIPYKTSVRARNITEICGKVLKAIPEPEVTVRIGVKAGRELPWGKLALWDEVWKLSERQVDLFVNELIFCDGSWGPNVGSSGVLYCVPDERRDDLRLLLTLNGYRTSIYEPRPKDIRLNISKNSTSYIHAATKIDREPYNGTVWCVSVPNGRFFVERGGKIHLTGNCFPRLYEKKILEDGTRYVRDNITHVPRGYRWEWHGLTFLALGGAASIDKKHRRTGYSWWPEELITVEDILTAQSGGPVDVMFTHDSPSTAPNSVTDDFRGQMEAMEYFGVNEVAYCTDHRERLAEVTNVTTPRLLIHGHYHMSMYGTYAHRDEKNTLGIVRGLHQGMSSLNNYTMVFNFDEVKNSIAELDMIKK